MFWTLAHDRDAVAVIGEGAGSLTYGELAARADAFAARLDAGRGMILLECAETLDGLAAYLGALRAGCPAALIAAGRAEDSARLLDAFGFAYRYDARTDRLETLRPANPPALHPDLAILLSTSGSTGAAKLVRLSYANLAANAASIVEYLGLGPQDRAPSCLPMSYSFGMSILNTHLAAGGALVMTERSAMDPLFWALFDRHGCTGFYGVPHSYELLEKSPVRFAERASLRYAAQAGGKLARDKVEARARAAAAEGWDFVVMYGQTEAAPRMSWLPADMAADHPDCIGRPVPGGRFRLEDAEGAEITAPDETGELIYEGPNVMMGYALSDDDLALGQGPAELRTGDMAQRTPEGLYRIVGRASRFIKPFGLRVSLDAVEERLAGQGIAAVCAGVDEALWVLVADAEADPGAIRADLAAWLKIPADGLHAVRVDEIPRLANGKPDLPAVKALAEGIAGTGEAAPSRPQAGDAGPLGRLKALGRRWRRAPAAETDGAGTVRRIFEDAFPGRPVSERDSFASLGGDSLSFVRMALTLEEVLGTLPEGWDHRPIADLAAMRTATPGPAYIDGVTLLRALAITVVVASHTQLLDYHAGGSILLLAVAGWNFAAFQIGTVTARDSIRSVLAMTARVAIPTILYLALLEVVFGAYDWRPLALHANWIDPDLNRRFSFWFVELYVQMMLILAVVLAFPPVRRLLKARPWECAVGFLALSTAVLAGSEALWSFDHVLRRVPHLLMWVFAGGIAACYADTVRRKALVTVMMLAAIAIYAGPLAPLWFFTWTMLGLIWINRVEIPRWSRRPIYAAAGASLFIYLTNLQFYAAGRYIAPDAHFLHFAMAMLGGVAVWKLHDLVTARIEGWWARRRGPARLKNPT